MMRNRHRRKLSLAIPASVFLLFSVLERVEVSALGDAVAFSLGLEEPAASQVVEVDYNEADEPCWGAGCAVGPTATSTVFGVRPLCLAGKQARKQDRA